MHHELIAIERQVMREKIEELQKMLKDMEADFAKCANGKSPCIYCVNNQSVCSHNKNNCNFVWNPHT